MTLSKLGSSIVNKNELQDILRLSWLKGRIIDVRNSVCSSYSTVLNVGGLQTSLKAILDLNWRCATSWGGLLLAPIMQVDQLPPALPISIFISGLYLPCKWNPAQIWGLLTRSKLLNRGYLDARAQLIRLVNPCYLAVIFVGWDVTCVNSKQFIRTSSI